MGVLVLKALVSAGVLVAATGLRERGTHDLPSKSDWKEFNTTLRGSLVHIRPPAQPCHLETFNLEACKTVKANWTNEFWRSDQIGAMWNAIWEQRDGHWCAIGSLDDTSPIDAQCAQGNVPMFGVNATSVADIQAAVNFASKHRLQLRIKGTGHDLSGRSTSFNALLIWTRNLQNIEIAQKTICGETLDTITVEAGVEWGVAYQAMHNFGRVTAGGGDPGVGASGGQPLGGGHSPFSNIYGLTTDQIVAFNVVTMDGSARRVSACQNSDLFWALRGGGGGTYAVVTSTTFRTYVDGPTAIAAVNISVAADQDAMAPVFDEFAQACPTLAEFGWSGTYEALTGNLLGSFSVPLIGGRSFESANASWQPFFSSLAKHPGVTINFGFVTQFPSWFEANEQALTVPPTSAGSVGSLGSRLIPKKSLQDSATRKKIVSLMSNFVSPFIPVVITFAGGGVSSRPNNSAVNPAWRTALWHVILAEALSENATQPQIETAFKAMTQDKVEPLRALTPGSGAYLGESDPAGPTWKEDFYGANYDRLLAIKRKYDPKLLLRCNRCVGSDL